jgi:hypothetical protein
MLGKGATAWLPSRQASYIRDAITELKLGHITTTTAH